MQTIINTIEEVIASKKQSIVYRKEEKERIQREIEKEQDSIWNLENELQAIKSGPGIIRLPSPQPENLSGCAASVGNGQALAGRKY